MLNIRFLIFVVPSYSKSQRMCITEVKECQDGREMEISLVNQLLIQLLALLDDVLLLEQLLQREVIRIKQAVDGRCVGKSHTPKHG